MTDNAIVCLLCNRRFQRDENGAADFLDHDCRKPSPNHPTNRTPKRSA